MIIGIQWLQQDLSRNQVATATILTATDPVILTHIRTHPVNVLIQIVQIPATLIRTLMRNSMLNALIRIAQIPVIHILTHTSLLMQVLGLSFIEHGDLFIQNVSLHF